MFEAGGGVPLVFLVQLCEDLAASQWEERALQCFLCSSFPVRESSHGVR